MAEIGKINKVTVRSTQDNTILLDGGELGDIILEEKYRPGRYKAGDNVQVFIYADRKGQLQALTNTPYATVDQFAKLRVTATSPAGAFLAWGMKDDILVPKSEQLNPMTK